MSTRLPRPRDTAARARRHRRQRSMPGQRLDSTQKDPFRQRPVCQTMTRGRITQHRGRCHRLGGARVAVPGARPERRPGRRALAHLRAPGLDRGRARRPRHARARASAGHAARRRPASQRSRHRPARRARGRCGPPRLDGGGLAHARHPAQRSRGGHALRAADRRRRALRARNRGRHRDRHPRLRSQPPGPGSRRRVRARHRPAVGTPGDRHRGALTDGDPLHPRATRGHLPPPGPLPLQALLRCADHQGRDAGGLPRARPRGQ